MFSGSAGPPEPSPRDRESWQPNPMRHPEITRECGTRYLIVMSQSQEWIHRRVDSFTFRGMQRLHQHTSIDFSVPHAPPTPRVWSLPEGEDAGVVAPVKEEADGRPDGSTEEITSSRSYYLPLMQIRKAPLVGYQLCNAAHEDICLITARQSRTLSCVGLLALADAHLGLSGEFSLLSDLGRSCEEFAEVDFEFVATPRIDLPAEGSSGSPLTMVGAASQRLDELRELRELQASLVRIVTADTDVAMAEVAGFREKAPPLKAKVWDTRAFQFLLPLLAESYFMTVALEKPLAGSRTVIEVDFERIIGSNRLRSPSPFATREIMNLGLKRWFTDLVWGSFIQPRIVAGLEDACLLPSHVSQEAHAAAAVESYHVELNAPAGMKIVGVKWKITPPQGDWKHPDRSPVSRAEERIQKDLGERPIDCYPDFGSDGEHTIAHSVVRPVPPGYSVNFRWRIAPLATGWLMVAFITSTLVVLVQAAYASTRLGLVSLAALDPDTDIGQAALQNRTTLVLGLVALGLTALLRSGEHPLTKRSLMWPRIEVLVILGSFLATSIDLFVVDPPMPVEGTEVLILLSTAAWFLLGLSWMMSIGPFRRRRRTWDRTKLARDYWEASL